MFRNPVTETPLTSDAANAYFRGKITGGAWNRDISFIATLRALLGEKIGDDHLELSFGDSGGNAPSSASGSDLDDVFGPYSEDHTLIHIHSFRSASADASTAWMEYTKKHFEKRFPGFHVIDKVSQFFRKYFNVLCFVNPERKSVALFVQNMGLREMHFLQCGIFAFLPWYFNQDEGVTDLEMQLIQSLREKSSDSYEACIARFAERYDFRTARIQQLLDGFESRYERIQIDGLRRELERRMATISDLNDRIGRELAQKRDTETRLMGLELKVSQDDGESEIMQYFLCNRKLSLREVDETTMTFVAMDYLTYYDEEMAKRVIQNRGSYVYSYHGALTEDQMEKLMTAVFLDHKLRVKFCAAFKFQLEGNVSAIAGYNYGAECREYMPNPHLDRYRCLGNYAQAINACLSDRNYIGALEQSLASCKSLNFADSAVMNVFMKRLQGREESNVRCIELPDGTVVRPKEAVEYLMKEEEAHGEAD